MLGEQTLQDLKAKHPEGKPLHPAMILEGPVENVNSVIYDSITSETMIKASIKNQGSCGAVIL